MGFNSGFKGLKKHMLILHALSADHRVQISGHVKGYHYVHEYFHNSISTAIFCVITQRVAVISYRHFRTTYQKGITTPCCVITQNQKSAVQFG